MVRRPLQAESPWRSCFVNGVRSGGNDNNTKNEGVFAPQCPHSPPEEEGSRIGNGGRVAAAASSPDLSDDRVLPP